MKRSLLLLALLALALPGLAQAQSSISFEPVSNTPYDSQMTRVESFMRTNASNPGDDIPTLDQVNGWMRQLKAIPYQYTNSWKTPGEMKASGTGDCKAKAVSLYYLMRAYGARNVMLVVGRKSSNSQGTHAWLIWKSQGRVFLLDPTAQSQAIEITGSDLKNYVPHFAYSGGKKFRPVAI